MTITLPFIDADSHLIEPADVWTSRVPARWAADVPRVERNPDTGRHHWIIGSEWLWPVGFFGQAGWPEHPPRTPWEYEDVEVSAYDATARLARMDRDGARCQVIYPNLIGFQAPLFAGLGTELSLMCTRAYNDFVVEWCAADPSRLVPVAMLPFWDVEASVREMERCVAAGHKGVLFANNFERIGLPSFCDTFWDPIYRVAQELDVPVNFHVGFGSFDMSELLRETSLAERRDVDAGRPDKARANTTTILNQADLMGRMLTSGLCQRFPRLRLVSVECGFGYMPFYLEGLDWHWKAYGNTGPMLPSEYFRRQCYGTFWFEKTTLPLLKDYPDNFMFSTDYPHGTGLAPGPASPAEALSDHVESAFAGVDPVVAHKALVSNAAAVYRLNAA